MPEYWINSNLLATTPGVGTQADPYAVNTPELWDQRFRNFPFGSVIHLAPGEYLTYGFAGNEEIPGQAPFKSGWNILGAGRDKTIIRLVPTPRKLERLDGCHSIFGVFYDALLENVVVQDLTLDLDMAAQNQGTRAFNGISFSGTRNSVVRNVRIIRWGTDSNITEGFPCAIFRGDGTPLKRSRRMPAHRPEPEKP